MFFTFICVQVGKHKLRPRLNQSQKGKKGHSHAESLSLDVALRRAWARVRTPGGVIGETVGGGGVFWARIGWGGGVNGVIGDSPTMLSTIEKGSDGCIKGEELAEGLLAFCYRELASEAKQGSYALLVVEELLISSVISSWQW